MIRSARLLCCAVLASVPTLGCAPPPPAPQEIQALLTVASVPADVACVRITAAGPGRTVEREVGVSPGGMINEAFSGLPLGTVAFKAEAFSGDCDAVTKSTIPGWASEPEAVAIVLGHQSTVSLTLNRNGRAKVQVDFNDEPLCTPTGSACIASAECCSKSCKTGMCVDRDGGADGGASDDAS
jgi:hypothetical protein